LISYDAPRWDAGLDPNEKWADYQWRVESDAARVQSTNWSFGARQAWWVATSEVHPMTVVSDKQAYAAMFHFLEQLYLRTKSDDLGGLLGGMSMLQDGSPADPAIEKDWQDAVAYALKDGGPSPLKLK
jgi:hypothetical protein